MWRHLTASTARPLAAAAAGTLPITAATTATLRLPAPPLAIANHVSGARSLGGYHLHRLFNRYPNTPRGPVSPAALQARQAKLLQQQQQHQTESDDTMASNGGNNEAYQAWSKDALIARIRELEAKTTTSTPVPTTEPPNPAPKSRKASKASKADRAFDFSKHPTRRIVLKLAYFGWNYQGLAAQLHTTNTVEHHLFEALTKAKLVADIKDADYARCGRTDKGVSATGNAVSLNVRSKVRNPGDEELPYLTIINRLLPPHIRVLAWAPVPDDFSARFSCAHRTYKYFFPALGLDIAKMREAASYFLGAHDFRNFCKIDPSKPVRNYERTVLAATIEPVHEGVTSGYGDPAAPPAALPLPSDFYTVTIQGTAFLWHQIRCMTYILFMVGQGLEPPTIVRDLLDVTAHPAKPQYDLAPEFPLVLWDCAYPQVEWQYADSVSDPMHAFTSLVKHVATLYETKRIETLTVDLMLKHLFAQSLPNPRGFLPSATGEPKPLPVPANAGEMVPFMELYPGILTRCETLPWGTLGSLFPIVTVTKRARTHLKLVDRLRCDTVDAKSDKLEAKKRKADEAAAAAEEEVDGDAPVKKARTDMA
ncbi:tRNA pseudouridine synthase A [Allomyces macrogynus ATCC 38327]|uniref:tRNA pseudouridine synthase A n=1 Tax=Allomyces macrogynus (strain ATCC 38327) TaxID=578462 RepID=A0A0L0SKG2_ALLM3|nr:tRNA pseudouridine synthase A [Allomyces macrogynus ATCC 38327]|eukprot:KNE62948.1 tRNA pseudouridine synthase A [Allomyces macrogynus ATCC 38327]